ncbi:hypothetical protein, conserved [Babesia ovata]|uniref:Extracellular matrix-binding ebh n=1 Tax=Babesia ovata TaxID=189622 RepID=A0A2H6KJQ9_9APIC|nr:uncharacterized protein BOVATA_047020 [Babesia ovata]GBE63209.1 hypothetical protein, conserved [Babesia ovata]
MDTVSPLVALAPLPAAHHRRPPRRPEDPLPPEITFKPPHRRAVPPRRRTRQGTRQRQIIDTIRELEGKIGKGSGVSGFCDAIGSVQQGLQGYEGKHTELTTNVLMDVNTIKSRITHLDSQFNDIRSKTLVNQLNDIKPVAADMSSTADLLWKDNDLLDDGLKKQLTPAVEKVKQAVGGFNSVAGDTGVTTQASLVDRAIEEKRQHLEGQINKGALELERKLDVEVKKIQSELTALKDETLKSEITLLRQALQDAKADIVDLLDNFDGTHKPQISEKFDQIKSALKDVLPDKKGKSPLDKQVDALKEKVGDTEGVYQHVLRNIKREVNSAVTSAAEHLTKVDEAVKRDLWTIRQNVEEQLNKYVKEYLRLVTEQLRIIKEKVGKDKNDNKDSIAKHWEVLTSRITTLVKMINGRDGETGKPYYKGLKGIKERVKVWREGFTDAKGFEKIVEKWIRSILKGNEDVKFWIKQYVDDNKRKNGDGCFNSGIIDTKHSQIEVIKDKIIQKLNRGEFEQTLYLAGRSGNNIQDNLNAVRFVCEKFAKQVGEKLAKKANDIKDYKKHLDDLVSQIVTEIEGVCKNGGTATENEHLEYAIAITLVALQSASRHTAKALGNFTTAKDKSKRITYNISTNVDAAIAGVALIKDILGDEHGSTNEPGSKITKALKDLDSQIEKLHGDLRKSTTSSDPASDPKLIQIEDSVEKRVENILSDNVGTNGSEGQVKKNFGEDGFMAAYNDETKLNAADGKLRDRINKINEPINKYFEKTSSTNIDFDALSEYIKTLEEYNNAIRDVKATVSKLETVPSSIETMSEETLQLLQELRQNIKRLETQIDGIQENVNNAERNIEEAIVSLHESVNKSHIKIYDETENFRKSLLSAVKSSFDSVKNSVQSLFARQKQAELTQLQSVVTEQLEKIEEIIREDKSTGVKGFLTILREGMFENFLSRSHPLKDGMKLSELAVQAVICFEGLFEYFDEELTPKNSRLVRTLHSQSTGPHAAMVENIRSVLNALLGHLINTKLKTYDFDHTFREKVHELTVSVGALSAKTFGEGRNPELLNIFKSGMLAFTTELGHAYVNKYSGMKFQDELLKKKDSDPSPNHLTTEGRNCAKVCLTILERVNEDLAYLKGKCDTTNGPWKHNKICETDGNKTNKLGRFFMNRGFTIPLNDGVKQDGQLRCSVNMKGGHICKKLLEKEIGGAKQIDHLKACNATKENEIKFNVLDILTCLRSHLHQYFRVGHISSFAKKSPCSIYEMLTWCCGLQYNSAYSKMQQHCKTLHQALEKEEKTMRK